MITSVVLTGACHEPRASKTTNYADCLACHAGIEKISDSHNFRCVSCHIKPRERSHKIIATHQRIVRNPSSLDHVHVFCLPCHENEIKQVQNSLHASMAGIINQTRYLWGAQKTAAPAVYGLSGALQPLPEPAAYPETPGLIVDDFLRRRCLRCHIRTPGPEGRGLYRATGCAACHVLYGDDGRYRGNDKAISQSMGGYPVKHEFTRLIPSVQCLHCHNQNHVGSDYMGLFEHDYSNAYRSPTIDGRSTPMIYGLDHHRLARDIHAEKGLWCIDCHEKEDVMGNGTSYSYEMEVPKNTCTDCHGGMDNPVPDLSLKSVQKESGEFVFLSRSQGQRHPLPLFSRGSIGHGIEAHGRVRCSACHAQWSYQDYGLSVIREDLMEGNQWYYLSDQGDPYLEGILKAQIGTPGRHYPISKDWLCREPRPGIWSAGWRFRRWEFMPLGVDHTNRYAIIRPLYQYLITYVDRLGNVPLDSNIPLRGDQSGTGWAFMPYVPHTTAPSGRPCTACHLNRVAAGLGINEEMTMDTCLTIPSPPAVHAMRLLNQDERNTLLKPSRRWQKERLRVLTGFPLDRK
jgi:hypothetical protein